MNKNYDVCIVCMNYISSDARVHNLINVLRDLNQKIAVIAFKEDLKENKNFDFYPIPIDSEDRLFKKVISFTNFTKNKYKNIKAKFYLSSDLYSLATARFLQKKNGGKLIYDSREIYSELANNSNKPLKQIIFKYFEKYYIRFVDKIVVTGNLDKEYLSSYFKNNTPYYLIMNLPNYREKINSNMIREKFGISAKTKILLYQGMLMKARGLETAIEIINKNREYALCIIGGSTPYKENLDELISKYGIQNQVFFTGQIPYEELHLWTCSADLGLTLFEPISLSYNLALPNKLFEYAMAGLPIIASDLPAIKDVAEDEKFIKFIKYPFDLEEMSKQIGELLDDENKDKISISIEKFTQKYNYQSQINEIKKVFEIQ